MDRPMLTALAARATRQPRVLFAIAGLDAGGSEGQLVELLVRIHPDEVDATLVTLDRGKDSPRLRRLLDAGVRHEPLGLLPTARAYVLGAARLARIFRSVRPDVVYPWLEPATVLVAPVARIYGVPVVIGRRNISGAAIERRLIAARAIRSAERLGAVVTANSNAVLDAAISRGISPKRLRLVRNGHPALPPLELPRGRPVRLGYVARFRQEKGHLRLLEALKQLELDETWRVDLAGEGFLMKTVRDEAERLGLARQIRFLGPVEDIRAFWAERAIAVLLSDHEGLPNALIEAAFCGRALVGTAVGGIPEVIAPSGGFVVRPDDTHAIAQALTDLIGSERLRRELGANAYSQARQRFGMTAFLEGHLGAINEALSAHRPTIAPWHEDRGSNR